MRPPDRAHSKEAEAKRQEEFLALSACLADLLNFLGPQSAFDTENWWIVDDDYGHMGVTIYFSRRCAGDFDEIVEAIQVCLDRFPRWRVYGQFYDPQKITKVVRSFRLTATELEIERFLGPDMD